MARSLHRRAGLATAGLRSYLELNATAIDKIESDECGVGAFEWAGPGMEITMAEQVNVTAQEARPDPNEKLVKVFDSEQESEAMVVKGLLESEGIESDLKSGSFVQDAFPGLGGMIILVREEDAERAKSLIAESRAAAPDVVSEDEVVDDDETVS